jgi:hypothetical protein
MKRNHGYVSSTPLFLQKKGRTSSRQHGLLGTPVEGLTSIPVSLDRLQSGLAALQMCVNGRFDVYCRLTPLTQMTAHRGSFQTQHNAGLRVSASTHR